MCYQVKQGGFSCVVHQGRAGEGIFNGAGTGHYRNDKIIFNFRAFTAATLSTVSSFLSSCVSWLLRRLPCQLHRPRLRRLRQYLSVVSPYHQAYISSRPLPIPLRDLTMTCDHCQHLTMTAANDREDDYWIL